MRWKLLTLLGAAVLVSALVVPSLVLAGGNPANKLKAHMTGDQVVPQGSGAPAGVGNASVTLRPQKQKICFRVAYRSIGPRAGLNAAIYKGKKGQNGAFVEKLFKGDKPSPVKGCANNVAKADMKAIRNDPKSYHVTVKTDKYKTNGAIRGQLRQRT
jgi:PDZ domain-containing secreted protein